jgi:hypothetical protein
MATSLPLKNKQLPLKLIRSPTLPWVEVLYYKRTKVHKTKGVAKSDGVGSATSKLNTVTLRRCCLT